MSGSLPAASVTTGHQRFGWLRRSARRRRTQTPRGKEAEFSVSGNTVFRHFTSVWDPHSLRRPRGLKSVRPRRRPPPRVAAKSVHPGGSPVHLGSRFTPVSPGCLRRSPGCRGLAPAVLPGRALSRGASWSRREAPERHGPSLGGRTPSRSRGAGQAENAPRQPTEPENLLAGGGSSSGRTASQRWAVRAALPRNPNLMAFSHFRAQMHPRCLGESRNTEQVHYGY